jgi:hypothetical protein
VLNFGIPGNLNGNQAAVGNALSNFFNSTGGIPLIDGALNAAQLSQASGELGTSSQQTTFDAMSQFMGLLTDPFMNRGGGTGSSPGATGYAEEGDVSADAASKRTDDARKATRCSPRCRWRTSTIRAGASGRPVSAARNRPAAIR